MDEQQRWQSSNKEDMLKQAHLSDRMGQVAQRLKGLSWEQKLQWGLERKAASNKLYSAGQWQQAADGYLEALMGLDMSGDATQQSQMNTEIKIPCLLNIAMCMLKQQQWSKAIDLCDKVLEVDPRSCKALLRRAQARMELDLLDEAQDDLRVVLENLNVSDASFSIYAARLSELQKTLRAKLKQEKQVYTKMFGSGRLYEDKQNQANNGVISRIGSWIRTVTDRCCRRKKNKST
eukprot:GILJ01016604.1.p1 GENE.GILJ01016604.1~~GILJ01016604.1.p1  ORF type:complete len:243 (+),score=40.77 GILJ01016604.1:30-731(+)